MDSSGRFPSALVSVGLPMSSSASEGDDITHSQPSPHHSNTAPPPAAPSPLWPPFMPSCALLSMPSPSAVFPWPLLTLPSWRAIVIGTPVPLDDPVGSRELPPSATTGRQAPQPARPAIKGRKVGEAKKKRRNVGERQREKYVIKSTYREVELRCRTQKECAAKIKEHAKELGTKSSGLSSRTVRRILSGKDNTGLNHSLRATKLERPSLPL
ncbi:unnamed protein product [Vitrella brassicaformis CCMP3155]|uniref:Uncharacterized protein n=1 Tax=Vitrella brassicaformis (strain CCMP3155) TaxID=1169540 RepID=A0A0G4GIR4_VITBC|nr:unnamed protein product [Vitrella brassicaformis CCMP3155]|eukprot:CEM29769.1 unnamed protein product [Vitrella brassicaformis CCMP3155]